MGLKKKIYKYFFQLKTLQNKICRLSKYLPPLDAVNYNVLHSLGLLNIEDTECVKFMDYPRTPMTYMYTFIQSVIF